MATVRAEAVISPTKSPRGNAGGRVSPSKDGRTSPSKKDGRTSPTKAFGTTAARFDVNGTHPRTRQPSKCLPTVYSPLEDERIRGPGLYEVKSMDFAQLKPGPAWEHEFDPTRFYGLPTLRQQHRQEQESEGKEHGPGTYDILTERHVDYIHARYLETRSPRLAPANKHLEMMPGPGMYLGNEIPANMRKKSTSKFGSMAGVGREDKQNSTVGTDLGPGQYEMEQYSSSSVLLKQTVGARGPIDLSQRARVTVFAEKKKSPSVPPGLYDPHYSPSQSYHFRYMDYQREPVFPTDRHTLANLHQRPRPLEDPSPNHYVLKGSTSVPRSFNVAEDFKFGVAASREDQLLGNPFLINNGTVDPGQYKVTTTIAPDTPGKGILGNASQRFETKAVNESYERERLRAKNYGSLNLTL